MVKNNKTGFFRIKLRNEKMELDIIGLVSACSYALDCIEAELVHVTNRHGKRVAYISVCMAEKFGITGEALQDLAMCALLHDNALTQYISEEVRHDLIKDQTMDISSKKLGVHCVYGEQNIKKLPFYTDVTNVILYHHENADGTGPFRKKWEEIPLFARIIHLCDTIDIIGNTGGYDQQNWEQAKAYLVKYENTIFDAECVKAFLEVFSEEKFADMGGEELEKRLWEKVPRKKQFCDEGTCKDLADFFAQIVDYKSEFTGMHSIGVAKKAAALAEHLGYDRLDIQKIYLAGALHDIGKMAIGNEILEKPGRLTDEEFSKMKNHAGYTYMILSEVEDFEEIRDWAALHHEKLDGSGYPFGRTAEELNEPERILACVDIYQALTEERPYKKGMSHEQACGILEDMAQKGWIDATITEKVRACFGQNL